MTKVRITEYLDVDLKGERWCCNRCGHDLGDARKNYKEGCLIAERELQDVHPSMVEHSTYSFTPDPDYCRLVEIYCPDCGTMLENEYLPPGHPLTHEIELDMDALKTRYAKDAG